MAERSKKQYAVCLDADTGKELWTRELAPGYLDFQRMGPGPRATPTYHDGKLYCLFPLGHFYCLNAADGKTLWQAHALKDTGAEDRSPERFFWGLSASPLVVGDHVIIHPGGSKGNSVAAFHKDTGKLVWKVGDDPPGYGTPFLINYGGVRMVIVTTAQSILAVDPLKGTLLFRHAWGNPYNCNCATPLWVDNVLYLSSAYNTGSSALELHVDNGRVTPKTLWANKSMQNQFATSIIHDGHMYGTNGTLSGYTLRCIELKTGTVKWSERGPEKSSFVSAQGHLFCLSSSGNLRVVEFNPERLVLKGEMLGLLGGNTWAAPALVNRRLYARDDKNLVCVDLTP
jgi:outer membrane protein assembly factor BamB